MLRPDRQRRTFLTGNPPTVLYFERPDGVCFGGRGLIRTLITATTPAAAAITIEEAPTHTVSLRLPEELQAYVLTGP
jgi:hypothetical protein